MSYEEMKQGLREGLFDTIPLYQVVRQAGTWERKHQRNEHPATPWSGLL